MAAVLMVAPSSRVLPTPPDTIEEVKVSTADRRPTSMVLPVHGSAWWPSAAPAKQSGQHLKQVLLRNCSPVAAPTPRLNPVATPMFDKSGIDFYHLYVTDSSHISG